MQLSQLGPLLQMLDTRRLYLIQYIGKSPGVDLEQIKEAVTATTNSEIYDLVEANILQRSTDGRYSIHPKMPEPVRALMLIQFPNFADQLACPCPACRVARANQEVGAYQKPQ